MLVLYSLEAIPILEKMDVNQVMALISAGAALLGAIIGAVATIATTWLNNKLQHVGKVRLFAHIVCFEPTQEQWGFYNIDGVLYFQIPIWLDVCNTSGVSRIIRDVNLYAYLGDKEISAFEQVQAYGKNRVALGDNESYTLVVPANSARRFNMFFTLSENELSSDNKSFDNVVLKYFDEENSIHACCFARPEKIWKQGSLKSVKNWITLDQEIKLSRKKSN